MNYFKQQTERLSASYKVKSNTQVKDIDLNKRIVSGLFNSYYYIDSDMDMLVMGSASKSIKERGVGSSAGNKIKHLKDHDWNKVIARLNVLDEREVEFNGQLLKGIYHESFYPTSTDSNDQLIKLQEGLYDDRSIGFQYTKLGLAEKESENDDSRKLWEQYLPLAMNPEKALDAGFFWVVTEIKLFEGSDVAFGANSLTPMLDIKGASKEDVINPLLDRVEKMSSLIRHSNMSDEGIQKLEMEKLQLKEFIKNIGLPMQNDPKHDLSVTDSKIIGIF